MSQHSAIPQHAARDNRQTWQTLEQKLDALLAYTQQLENTNRALTLQIIQHEDDKRKLAQEHSKIRQQLEQITRQMLSIEGKTRDV